MRELVRRSGSTQYRVQHAAYFALAWAAISICAAGAAALLINSEARAQAPLLDPGWQFYGGGQSGGVNSGFIAHTFGTGTIRLSTRAGVLPQRDLLPSPHQRRRAVTSSGRRRNITPPFRAQPPSAYRQPAPPRYDAPPAQLRGAYQPPAAKYYASAPAPQGRGIQHRAYYQQPAPPSDRVSAAAAIRSAAALSAAVVWAPRLVARVCAIKQWRHGATDGRSEIRPPGRRLPGRPAAGHDHHRYPALFSLSGAAGRQGAALRHRRRPPGLHLGRDEEVSAMREWPDWQPPDDMLKRRPDLPRYMPGGPENPLGARAMYLGSTLYRIHGSTSPGPSARKCRRAVSACATRTSSTFTVV